MLSPEVAYFLTDTLKHRAHVFHRVVVSALSVVHLRCILPFLNVTFRSTSSCYSPIHSTVIFYDELLSYTEFRGGNSDLLSGARAHAAILSSCSTGSQQREDLCKPLTQSEIKSCIQLLPNKKAPGPDGFCAEFYEKFNAILVDPLFV